ncbi:hypothetical protein P152DRAFT_486873 [Eremomyces bilateralis CBS 781.70]|uniref:F-box domain-containing protein n=1 Tax=Eremomyces bilateralis CBS 781.70 TaxID=1392243 RepID=A0A6G1GHH6_9PEZI|nr:uncharacterized protein P152DRAFT_486873 [Eremomyces bilateralis CBS 781.70]KAF1817320.1 hypothetical protein P152DRAFT_486873 [Eremomyces bilateralis CBS 781.70]
MNQNKLNLEDLNDDVLCVVADHLSGNDLATLRYTSRRLAAGTARSFRARFVVHRRLVFSEYPLQREVLRLISRPYLRKQVRTLTIQSHHCWCITAWYTQTMPSLVALLELVNPRTIRIQLEPSRSECPLLYTLSQEWEVGVKLLKAAVKEASGCQSTEVIVEEPYMPLFDYNTRYAEY